MSDSFEARLEALFEDQPERDDAVFRAALMQRLRRRLRLRRLALAVTGIAGAAVAALAMAPLLPRAAELAHRAALPDLGNVTSLGIAGLWTAVGAVMLLVHVAGSRLRGSGWV